MQLQEWWNSNPIDSKMRWQGGAEDQFIFARDFLQPLIGAGLFFQDRRSLGTVISTHRSKSIDLPVYCFRRLDLGLTLVLRNNFYNWKLSVVSNTPIQADFEGLFYTTSPIEPDYTGNPLAPIYFEGFPSEYVFGYYEESDKKQWSAEINNNYSLYTTVWLIMKSLNAVKPRVWRTSESHKKELEERTSV